MILEGRIVGVRMLKSSKVGYALQPERILAIESEDKGLLEKLHNGDKRYPVLRFVLPAIGATRILDAFSLGYCLMERKPLIRIKCRTPNPNEIVYAKDDFVVESLGVGIGFEPPKTEDRTEDEKPKYKQQKWTGEKK